ncbi:hypothetical protein TNCV_3134821 [Trichonephila clavipes]|nr:hypothetical protein TNCV_3134821 [Trichonephila clavipes]
MRLIWSLLFAQSYEKEVHRLVNQTQESLDSDPQSLEEIVQDEVERVLAPVSTKPTETRPDQHTPLHDVILGWDFLEASQAVIDCGQNELVLEDICRDSTAPDIPGICMPPGTIHLSRIL